MNVVHVLVSAIKESRQDALLVDNQHSEDTSSETTAAVTTLTVVDNELLDSSKAQILTLLDVYDGRMYQQDLVAETELSAATISRLLSELEDDDRIARLRKGREKIVVDPQLVPPVLTEKS